MVTPQDSANSGSHVAGIPSEFCQFGRFTKSGLSDVAGRIRRGTQNPAPKKPGQCTADSLREISANLSIFTPENASTGVAAPTWDSGSAFQHAATD
jgi:hypothetical protein